MAEAPERAITPVIMGDAPSATTMGGDLEGLAEFNASDVDAAEVKPKFLLRIREVAGTGNLLFEAVDPSTRMHWGTMTTEHIFHDSEALTEAMKSYEDSVLDTPFITHLCNVFHLAAATDYPDLFQGQVEYFRQVLRGEEVIESKLIYST